MNQLLHYFSYLYLVIKLDENVYRANNLLRLSVFLFDAHLTPTCHTDALSRGEIDASIIGLPPY
jgi:hypothetical protein